MAEFLSPREEKDSNRLESETELRERFVNQWTKPFEDLRSLEILKNTTPQITVSWKEFDQGQWNQYTASGPFNERFLRWVRNHYSFWYGKPPAFLRLQKLEDDLTAENHGQSSW